MKLANLCSDKRANSPLKTRTRIQSNPPKTSLFKEGERQNWPSHTSASSYTVRAPSRWSMFSLPRLNLKILFSAALILSSPTALVHAQYQSGEGQCLGGQCTGLSTRSGNLPNQPSQTNPNMDQRVKTVTEISIPNPFAAAPRDWESTGLTQKEYSRQFDKFKSRITKLLGHIASPSVLENLLGKKGCKILIRPSAVQDGGGFNLEHNAIIIEMNEEFSDSIIINILRNEIYHASVAHSLQAETVGNFKVLPKYLREKMKTVIENGKKKINYYKNKLEKNKKNLTEKEKNNLVKLVNAAQNYIPFNSYESKNSNEHQNFIHNRNFIKLSGDENSDSYWLIPAGKYQINNKNTIANMYVKIRKLKNDFLYTYSHYDESLGVNSKSIAFVNDILSRHLFYYSEGTNMDYSKQEEALQIENLVSDLAMLPKELLDFIFPGFTKIIYEVTGDEKFFNIRAF